MPPVDKDVVVSVVSALLNGVGNLIKRLPSHRAEQDGILEHLMKLSVMSMNQLRGNLEIREKVRSVNGPGGCFTVVFVHPSTCALQGRCILHHAIQTMSIERFVAVFPKAMPTLIDAPPASPQDVNDTLALINQVMVGLQVCCCLCSCPARIHGADCAADCTVSTGKSHANIEAKNQ